MGVTGLWDLVSPVGHRVSNEHVRNKVLAVDLSIWLTQFVKAMRDAEGAKMRNAHLLGVLRRCLKLLFLAVKPVMIFDGETPLIKRRTLAKRHATREQHAANLRRLAEKLLLNRLKQSALKHAIPSHVAKAAAKVTTRKNAEQKSIIDDFDKPIQIDDDDDDEQEDEDVALPNDLDVIDDDTLLCLPSKVQAKVLKLMKLQNRTRHREDMFQHQSNPTEFSNTQIEGFLQRTALNRRINRVRNTINKNSGAENRIASDSSRKYIFEERTSRSNKTSVPASTAANKSVYGIFDDDDDDFDDEDDDVLSRKDKSKEPTVDLLARIRAEKEAQNPRRARLPVNLSPQERQKRENKSGVGWASRVLQDQGGLKLSGNHLINDINNNNNEDDDCSIESDEDQWEDGDVDYGTHEANNNTSNECTEDGGSNNEKDDDDDDDVEWIDGTEDENKSVGIYQPADMTSHTLSLSELGRLALANEKMLDAANAEHERQKQMAKSRRLKTSSTFNATVDNYDDNDIQPSIHVNSDELNKENIKEKAINDSLAPSSGVEQAEEIDNKAINQISVDEKGDGIDEINPVNMQNSDTAKPNHGKREDKSEHSGEIADISVAIGSRDDCLDKTKPPLDNPSDYDKNSNQTEKEQWNVGAEDEEQSIKNNQLIDLLPANNDQAVELYETLSAAKDQNKDNRGGNQSSGNLNIRADHVGRTEETDDVEDLAVVTGREVNELDDITPVSNNQLGNSRKIDRLDAGHSKDLANREEEADIQEAIAMSLEQSTNEPIGGSSSPDKVTVDDKAKSVDDIYADPELDEITPVHKAPAEAHSTQEKAGDEEDANNWGMEDEEALLVAESEALWGPDSERRAPGPRKPNQPLSPGGVERLRKDLEAEEEKIRRMKNSHQAGLDSVSDEMYAETRDLLKLLGIPYLQAPSEAEAQCAFLNVNKLVDGIISEDSDSFLFGAQTVYRKLFISGQFAEAYEAVDIAQKLGLDRASLIRLAYLLGSDYTAGVRGVGVVNSMEIMEAFNGENGLKEFREWMEKITILDKQPDEDIINTENTSAQAVRVRFCWKHRNMKRNWEIRDSQFPNEAVADAYWNPQVDNNLAKFKWGRVDFDGLARFCWEKFAWSPEKFHTYVGPVKKELETRGGPQQRRIDEFFKPHRFAKIRSERLQGAVLGIVGEEAEELMAPVIPKLPKRKRSTAAHTKPQDVAVDSNDETNEQLIEEDQLMVKALEDVERSRSMDSIAQKKSTTAGRAPRKRTRRK